MTVDDVIQPLFDPGRESPLWMRTRLVGKPLRAVAFALGGLVLLAAGIAVIVWSSHAETFPNVWTWTSAAFTAAGGALLAMAVYDGSRPLWRVGSRTLGRGVRRDGSPSWHPRIAGPVDEYRRTTQLNEAHAAAPLPLIVNLIREGLSPRVRARLVFDDAPLRRGARAKMTFTASAARRTIDGERTSFHLRCFEESPDVILPCAAASDASPTSRLCGGGTRTETRSRRNWSSGSRTSSRRPTWERRRRATGSCRSPSADSTGRIARSSMSP